MRASLTLALGAIGAAAAAMAPAASADNLNSVVRNLNAILNPDDARRMEEQARRNHRIEEERYWHNYGAGLEEQRRGRPDRREEFGSRGPDRRIDRDEARHLEERARREGHWDEARYWAAYRAGLERR